MDSAALRPGAGSPDRFTDSTLVYQGAGRGWVQKSFTTGSDRVPGLIPELTLVIDIDTETGLARARTEDSETRMEEQDIGFHRRLPDACR